MDTAKPIIDDIMYGRTALREGLPWITPNSLTALEPRLHPDWRTFEWGAGGSTVYWARHCEHVVSVEHNKDWIERVTKMVREAHVAEAVSLLYVRGDGSGDAKTAFRDYADVILDWPEDSFDLIMVDGEASCRGWCLTNAMSRIKVGGILVLDNSDWLKRDLGPDWQREDFVVRGLKWIGQKGTFDWWTSLVTRIA
jgi:predicted O-methyltransferase YrrM